MRTNYIVKSFKQNGDFVGYLGLWDANGMMIWCPEKEKAQVYDNKEVIKPFDGTGWEEGKSDETGRYEIEEIQVESVEDETVVYTGSIPQCPYCKKPTERTGGSGSVTTAYYPPRYDKDGVNVNPDRNKITSNWQCMECLKHYTTYGNHPDGFHYK